MIHSPADIVAAHQYLYYVVSTPIWSDRAYDAYCRANGIAGGGGSDLGSSYPPHVKALAHQMSLKPHAFKEPTASQIEAWLQLSDPTFLKLFGPTDDECI